MYLVQRSTREDILNIYYNMHVINHSTYSKITHCLSISKIVLVKKMLCNVNSTN